MVIINEILLILRRDLMKRIKVLIALGVITSLTALGACNRSTEPTETDKDQEVVTTDETQQPQDTVDEDTRVVPDETDQIATPEEEFIFDSASGTITGYREQGSKVVIIPDRIDETVVSIIGEEAFKEMNLESVNIPNTVSEIRDGAFQGNNLESVQIPSNVVMIGEEAFKDNNLNNLSIPVGVQRIGNEAFKDNNLSEVDVPENTDLGDEVFDDNVTLTRTN
jgi:hypothetical protein